MTATSSSTTATSSRRPHRSSREPRRGPPGSGARAAVAADDDADGSGTAVIALLRGIPIILPGTRVLRRPAPGAIPTAPGAVRRTGPRPPIPYRRWRRIGSREDPRGPRGALL
ncbi:hypothetical protein GCM10009727_87510 [Actinomadura napierensis]|uniref:Uncharacterized protein n=1 Tax=Actinomadura napierensis TaxID=267854 RepID=A0ABN3AGB8_9ACTN